MKNIKPTDRNTRRHQTFLTIHGKIDFQGSVDVTDPTFNRSEKDSRVNDLKIKDGVYTCCTWRTANDPSLSYNRNRTLVTGIYLNGYIPAKGQMSVIGDIEVEGGMAGFFHEKPDYDADEAYDIYDTAASSEDRVAFDPEKKVFCGFAGWGDGDYSLYVLKDSADVGEIIALELRFG